MVIFSERGFSTLHFTSSSRKQMSEPEKPQVSTSGSSKSTLKAALQELRRKGSAISLFSGLSVSTMLSDQPDLPPLDKPIEDPKRLERMKSRDAGQMGASEDDQPGLDPATSVESRHISLGECIRTKVR